MALIVIRFTSLMLTALLAGTSFGIWIGLNPKDYSPATYLEQQQHLVQALHALMVTMVILATLFTLISAFMQRQHKPVFIGLLAASTFLFSCIIISRFGNLPIQQEMLTWTVDTIPDNWTVLRDKWWTLHVFRTIAELCALTIIAWTTISNRILNAP